MRFSWSTACFWHPLLARPNTWTLLPEGDGISARLAYVPSAETRIQWRLRLFTSAREDPDAVPLWELEDGTWRCGPRHVFARVDPCCVDLVDAPPWVVEAFRRL